MLDRNIYFEWVKCGTQRLLFEFGNTSIVGPIGPQTVLTNSFPGSHKIFHHEKVLQSNRFMKYPVKYL